MAAPTIVPSGPYFGFTKAELLAELARYKAQRKLAGSDLASSSVAGQSFTFGPRRDWSLEQWAAAIQAALSALEPTTYLAADVPGDRARPGFVVS